MRAPFHDEIFGYESALPEWTYQAFLDHVLPEDRKLVEQAYQGRSRGGAAPVECRIRRSDDGEDTAGSRCMGGSPRVAPMGRWCACTACCATSPTASGTEAALRASEARLRSILETIPEAMIGTEEGGIIESL